MEGPSVILLQVRAVIRGQLAWKNARINNQKSGRLLINRIQVVGGGRFMHSTPDGGKMLEGCEGVIDCKTSYPSNLLAVFVDTVLIKIVCLFRKTTVET